MSSGSGAERRLAAQQDFVRHQNLPVRGFFRRRPAGNTSALSNTNTNTNPGVDFLLIGGFCRNSIYKDVMDKAVVSGGFVSPTPQVANANAYQMVTRNNFSGSLNNTNPLPYYPQCEKVLGDCCVEYLNWTVKKRRWVKQGDNWILQENGEVTLEEAVCFGGRSSENDTAIAHSVPSVLVFAASGQAETTAVWNYTKYPPQPHPRWSAASVTIRDYKRIGETLACDRIFIIGGRNKDGLVPEVDVFNLSTGEWETDWKGLNEGELEDAPVSSGGGSTIIINGGGDPKAMTDAEVNEMLKKVGMK
jgi:hypothetical protein